jgi:hypothetical protein
MNISLGNIGPIRKADFNLDKRFYVFVGYNNSGKTYASYILWALFSNRDRLPFFGDFPKLDIPELDKSTSVVEIIISNEKIIEIIDFYASILVDELGDIFNIDNKNVALKKAKISFKEDFVRKWKQVKMKTYFADNFSDIPSGSEYVVEKLSKQSSIKFYKVDYKAKNPKFFSDNKIDFMTSIRDTPESTAEYLVNYIVMSQLLKFRHKAFFLPANRIFFPSYFKYIYSTETNEYRNVRRHLRGSRSISANMISEYPHTEPVSRLIEAISSLPKIEARDFYKDLIDELEELISGQITFSQKEGIAPLEFKLKLKSGNDIDMYLASSSSNQLTMLYLYFKYWANKGSNLLIIDEPEENLHPKNQIKLTNILLKFANRDNNKVLITTHSPLVAETINNDMYASFIREEDPDSATSLISGEYSIENTLKSTDYGVYFFEEGRTSEYKADSYGVYFKDFIKEETKVKETSDLLRAHISLIKSKND